MRVGAKLRWVGGLWVAGLLTAGNVFSEAGEVHPCLDGKAVETHVEAVDRGDLKLADGEVARLAWIRVSRDAAMPRQGAAITYHPLSSSRDRHGRAYAIVVVGGTTLQERLLSSGAAFVTPVTPLRRVTPPTACLQRLMAIEAAARDDLRGVWANGNTTRRAGDPTLVEEVGRFAIIEGRVLSVGDRARSTYLNFGRFWREDFTVVVPGRVRRSMMEGDVPTAREARLAPLFEGRRVRVRGFLEDWGGPSVRIEHPAQIEVLDAEPALD